MNAFKLLLTSVFMMLALISCVDIEVQFILKRDGKGYLELTYDMDVEATTLLDANDQRPAIPLPITRQDFETALSGADGVKMRRFRRSDDEEGVHISARIAFDSVEDLRSIAGFESLSVSYEADGHGGGVLSQRVIPERELNKVPDKASIEFLHSIASESRISFVVVAPAKIRSATGASVDSRGRTARFSRTLADYLLEQGPVDLIIRW